MNKQFKNQKQHAFAMWYESAQFHTAMLDKAAKDFMQLTAFTAVIATALIWKALPIVSLLDWALVAVIVAMPAFCGYGWIQFHIRRRKFKAEFAKKLRFFSDTAQQQGDFETYAFIQEYQI